MENCAFDKARCLACGYSLRGLPEETVRCPECGRGFDWGDPRTYDDGSAEVRWVCWARPPGWMHTLLVLGVTWKVVEAASYPFTADVGPWCFVASPLVLYYVVRAGIVRSCGRSGLEPIRRRGRAWWVPMPVCIGLAVIALVTELPLRVRFEVSRAAMEAATRQQMAAATTLPCPPELDAYGITGHGFDSTSCSYAFFYVGDPDREVGFMYVADTRNVPTFFHLRRPSWLPEGWALFADR